MRGVFSAAQLDGGGFASLPPRYAALFSSFFFSLSLAPSIFRLVEESLRAKQCGESKHMLTADVDIPTINHPFGLFNTD